MPYNGFDDNKQGEGPEKHGPGRINCNGESQRKRSCYGRPDVRHKAQHRCENAPQNGAWNANQPQARSDNDTKTSIQKELNEEKSAKSACRIVKGGRGAL